jgi:hypothetical protein
MSSILTCGPFLHQLTHLGYRKRNLRSTSSMPPDGAPFTPMWPRDLVSSLFHNFLFRLWGLGTRNSPQHPRHLPWCPNPCHLNCLGALLVSLCPKANFPLVFSIKNVPWIFEQKLLCPFDTKIRALLTWPSTTELFWPYPHYVDMVTCCYSEAGGFARVSPKPWCTKRWH